MFDPSQLDLTAQAVLLREVAALVAAGIAADTSGEIAAVVLDELVGAGRQLDLAMVKVTDRVARSGIFGQDGSRSAVAYVRRAANESHAWAAARVHLGRALADGMPSVLAAWHADRIGMAQATIIAGAIKDLESELAGEIETILAEAASEISTNDLRGLAEMIVAQAAPEEAAERDKQNYERQTLSLSKTMDGQWKLDGRLDAEAGAIVRAALDAFTRKPESILGPDGVNLDTATPGFRRAQGFTEMCRQAAAHAEDCQPGGGKATIIVTGDKSDVLHGIGYGDIEGGSILPGAAIRRLTCDAAILASSLRSDGTTLNFGRTTRTISSGLRTHLISRDGGCVFPGCDARPAWCQVHHLIHWGRGRRGRTEPRNLILLCHFHHHLMHEGGWTTSGTADTPGTLLFHSPNGEPPRAAERHSIRRKAEHLLRC
jgi:hypothetical protein